MKKREVKGVGWGEGVDARWIKITVHHRRKVAREESPTYSRKEIERREKSQREKGTPRVNESYRYGFTQGDEKFAEWNEVSTATSFSTATPAGDRVLSAAKQRRIKGRCISEGGSWTRSINSH